MVESRQDEVLAIVALFAVFAFIFVGLRVYSRFLGHNFGWDDYLIIGAAFIFLGATIATWEYILRSGTGYHVWDIPKKPIAEQVKNNQWNFAVQMFYHPLMFTIRASIIMFLWRMKDNRRRIRYSLHAVWWINVMYGISTSLVNILQCDPVQYAWRRPAMDKTLPDGTIVRGGKCIDSRTFILTSCALSIFMDIIVIPIPSIMVWNLQMDRKTKMLVVIVMSLGWIATGVSVGRFIVYYYRFAPSNTDRTWDIGIAISIAEPAVHIMTACAPATKCLFRYLFPYFARSSSRSRTNGTTFYEDRVTKSANGNSVSISGAGKRSRAFDRFSFGLEGKMGGGNGSADSGSGMGEEISMNAKPSNKESYGMKRLSTVDSRESLSTREREHEHEHEQDGKSLVVEAEPKHCLAQAK